MTSLSFPDINVWLAILLADHIHRDQAKVWWETDQSDVIAFLRLTQIGVLRLLTTSAAMNNKPLTMPEAWSAYDQLFADERVAFLEEPRGLEARFRQYSGDEQASPKRWADTWLLAFADESGGAIITFDQALAGRTENCVLLK